MKGGTLTWRSERQRRWNRGNFPPDFFPGRRGRVADAETARSPLARRCRKIDRRVSRRPERNSARFSRFPSCSFRRCPDTILPLVRFPTVKRLRLRRCTVNHKAWWPIPARLSCVMCFTSWRICECGRERAAKNREETRRRLSARGTIASKESVRSKNEKYKRRNVFLSHEKKGLFNPSWFLYWNKTQLGTSSR